MGKTQKARKGPLVSATAYSVGTIMKGANGTMWEIRSTKTGVHRWTRTEKKTETRKKVPAPIKNYRGMWTPQPKPLSKMSREELIGHLRKFRNAWEKITTRNTDLSNERLASESTQELRELLKFYYTENAKMLAEEWLR